MDTGYRPLVEVDAGVGIGFLGHVVGNYDYSAAATRFYRAIADGRLELPRCDACETVLHPRREICPRCLGTELSGRTVSGAGEVYSFSVMAMTPFGAMADDVPYIVGIVRLDEGVSLFGRIVVAPEEVRIGMPVRVDLNTSADGVRFVPGTTGAERP